MMPRSSQITLEGLALSQASFSQSLATGKLGESSIAKWLLSRGHCVLPAYEIEGGQYKGPQLYTERSPLIAPDLLCLGKKLCWVEAKHKDAFTFHRISGRFVTGLDRRHYREYIEVQAATSIPVWIMFLHRGGVAIDSPKSPSGLFGNSITFLKDHVNHEHDGWGSGGMVYWAINSLKKLGNVDADGEITSL